MDRLRFHLQIIWFKSKNESEMKIPLKDRLTVRIRWARVHRQAGKRWLCTERKHAARWFWLTAANTMVTEGMTTVCSYKLTFLSPLSKFLLDESQDRRSQPEQASSRAPTDLINDCFPENMPPASLFFFKSPQWRLENELTISQSLLWLAHNLRSLELKRRDERRSQVSFNITRMSLRNFLCCLIPHHVVLLLFWS